MSKISITRNALILSLFLLAITSCEDYEYQSTRSTSYFDIDSLVSKQIVALTELKAELYKEAKLGDESESVRLHPDSLDWENELKIFRDSNINKYAFLGLYTERNRIQDEFSNLYFDEFRAENSKKMAVDVLRVHYLNSPEFLKKIVIEMSSQNELFESIQKLQMIFDDVDGRPILKAYEINGTQKLKLNNPVVYEVKASIAF